MDLADQAQRQNSIAEQMNLRNSRKPEGPPPTGYCLHCGEQFKASEKIKRWCDSQCRDDYERFSRRT